MTSLPTNMIDDNNTSTQADRQADRQTHRKAGGLKDKQTGTQIIPSRKCWNRAFKPSKNSTWTQFESTPRSGLSTTTWPESICASELLRAFVSLPESDTDRHCKKIDSNRHLRRGSTRPCRGCLFNIARACAGKWTLPDTFELAQHGLVEGVCSILPEPVQENGL